MSYPLLNRAKLVDLFPKSTIKERDNLPTGAGAGGAECRFAGARGDAVLQRPRHSLRVIRAGGYIVKLSIIGGRRTSCRFPYVLYRCGAGTGRICAERGTGYHALFSGPQRGLIVIVSGLYVCKGVADGWLRGTVGTIQERQNLGVGAGAVGGERGRAGAAGNFLLYGPLYCVSIVIVGLYVSEYTGIIRIRGRLF